MGRAIALKPWTFNAREATVLDEEVAGIQMDVEWTLPLRAKRKTSSMHSLNRRSQLVRLGLPSRFGDSTVPMSFPPYLSDVGDEQLLMIIARRHVQRSAIARAAAPACCHRPAVAH